MSESNDLRPIKKRGCFLTGLLVVQLIISIIGFFPGLLNSINYDKYVDNIKNIANDPNNALSVFYQNMPILTRPHLIISTIINLALIITIILMFKWVKNAIYAYGAIAIINYLVSFIFVGFSVSTLITSTIGLVIALLIAYFLLKALNKYEEQMAIYEQDTTNY